MCTQFNFCSFTASIQNLQPAHMSSFAHHRWMVLLMNCNVHIQSSAKHLAGAAPALRNSKLKINLENRHTS